MTGKKIAWYENVPDNQKMSYRIVPLPGALMQASLVGGQLRALSRLMTALSDPSEYPVKTFISDISMDDEGAVKFDLVVLPEMPKGDPDGDSLGESE